MYANTSNKILVFYISKVILTKLAKQNKKKKSKLNISTLLIELK